MSARYFVSLLWICAFLLVTSKTFKGARWKPLTSRRISKFDYILCNCRVYQCSTYNVQRTTYTLLWSDSFYPEHARNSFHFSWHCSETRHYFSLVLSRFTCSSQAVYQFILKWRHYYLNYISMQYRSWIFVSFDHNEYLCYAFPLLKAGQLPTDNTIYFLQLSQQCQRFKFE